MSATCSKNLNIRLAWFKYVQKNNLRAGAEETFNNVKHNLLQ